MTSVGAHSKVRLWPFVVKGRDDRYVVIDRGSRRAISTSEAGALAIRLLNKGRTVEQTREALGRRYGHPAAEVDLSPLLETLFASGFVRALDGRQVAAPREAARREPAGHALGLWITLVVWGPLLELALRYLPLRLALPLAHRWFVLISRPQRDVVIAENLRRAPDLLRANADVAGIVAANARAVRRQFGDRLLLASLPARRLRRWLGRGVRVTGLEHLERAAASGRGVILCSFHVGSYGLIPFVLAARGMAVTVYSGFGTDARANVGDWLAERSRHGDAFPMGVVGGGMGLRTLTRCLEQGGTILLYIDQAPGAEGRAPEARGWIEAPFLGTRIWCPRGVGWLRLRTGAAVLPVALLWERGAHHLRIDAELDCAGDAAVTLAVYAALERYVRREPAQWLKWGEFGAMNATRI